MYLQHSDPFELIDRAVIIIIILLWLCIKHQWTTCTSGGSQRRLLVTMRGRATNTLNTRIICRYLHFIIIADTGGGDKTLGGMVSNPEADHKVWELALKSWCRTLYLLLCPPLTMTPAAPDHHYPVWGHEGDTGHTRCPSVSSPHLTSHNNTRNDRELVSQLRRIRRIFHPFKFSPARPHYFCGWTLSEMWGPPVTSQHLMTAVTRGIIVPRPEYFHFAVRREDEIWVNTEQSVMLWCSSSSGVITVARGEWPGQPGELLSDSRGDCFQRGPWTATYKNSLVWDLIWRSHLADIGRLAQTRIDHLRQANRFNFIGSNWSLVSYKFTTIKVQMSKIKRVKKCKGKYTIHKRGNKFFFKI